MEVTGALKTNDPWTGRNSNEPSCGGTSGSPGGYIKGLPCGQDDSGGNGHGKYLYGEGFPTSPNKVLEERNSTPREEGSAGCIVCSLFYSQTTPGEIVASPLLYGIRQTPL